MSKRKVSLPVVSTKDMINLFQCPGCVLGSNTNCGSFKLENYSCGSHVPGTSVLGGPTIFLGMPKGYNRFIAEKTPIYFFESIEQHDQMGFSFNKLNIPVWGTVKEKSFLFVRVFSPRLGQSHIHVIYGGTWDSLKAFGTLDSSNFEEEFD